ncbi:MAG: DUF4358 domain-containing protein [Lachnospiraceae bacterium]|nr:DUF4358 domain-containing protein [Lachnospiraceae bacterium]MBR5766605.1 DUF4358 domain-containing protein [Lachnospiraceae bacterium]MBR6469189.1 DUF4358 domain-containing protein [Lachnospiraceae bacterium]MBR6487036.1 DUF4358 domain-containing protein [Lachnospiraceae bacterium]
MRKKTVCILMVAVMLLMTAGCKGSADVDAKALADALRNQVTYNDDLASIDLDTAGMFYSFGDAEINEAYFYESSGATAEEIVVIKCASDADAGKVEEILKRRVEEQKESFKDYVPAELEKLNTAIVKRSGKCVILSVSDEPDKAGDIIRSYAK